MSLSYANTSLPHRVRCKRKADGKANRAKAAYSSNEDRLLFSLKGLFFSFFVFHLNKIEAFAGLSIRGILTETYNSKYAFVASHECMAIRVCQYFCVNQFIK